MVKIFACKECGQVYYTKPPRKCIKHNIFTEKCNSVNFERIKEENVLNIHDIPKFLWEIFIKKLF